MLATAERVRSQDDTPDELIWHVPAGKHPCVGNCDFCDRVQPRRRNRGPRPQA